MTKTTEIAYKGFHSDLTCHGYQYEVGKEYTHEGKVECCHSGFHACTNPFDVLDYYNMSDGNRFCLIEQSGEIIKDNDDSKQASSKIWIKAEIGVYGLFKAGIEWIKEKTNPARIIEDTRSEEAGMVNSAQIGSSGDNAQIGSSGYRAQIGSSGYRAQIGSSGDNAQIGSSGDWTQISSDGKFSVICCAGKNLSQKQKRDRGLPCQNGNIQKRKKQKSLYVSKPNTLTASALKQIHGTNWKMAILLL